MNEKIENGEADELEKLLDENEKGLTIDEIVEAEGDDLIETADLSPEDVIVVADDEAEAEEIIEEIADPEPKAEEVSKEEKKKNEKFLKDVENAKKKIIKSFDDLEKALEKSAEIKGYKVKPRALRLGIKALHGAKEAVERYLKIY